MNQSNLEWLNLRQLQAKINSKRELYNFLLQDCKAYLPPYKQVNVYFLSQVAKGHKEVALHA